MLGKKRFNINDMVTLVKALTGKIPMNGGLKVATKLEEFSIKNEFTSARNILDHEVSTYSRTYRVMLE